MVLKYEENINGHILYLNNFVMNLSTNNEYVINVVQGMHKT